MKKIIVTFATALISASAFAGPAPVLPNGPMYLEYTGQEQIAINNAYTWTQGGIKEINWGVFVVTSVAEGIVTTPNQLITKDTGDAAFFQNMSSGGQITGMFYGIQKGEKSDTNPFPATSGFLDLYWRDASAPGFVSVGGRYTLPTPAIRSAFDQAGAYTNGTLLAHLRFDVGMDTSSNVNTIVGTQVPSGTSFSGSASSYLSVDTSKIGLWSNALDGNWFSTALGMADLQLDNKYTYNAAWNGKNGNGTTNKNILGAQVGSGSGQAYVLPEPGALSLMGLALVGMGAVLRRRRG